MSVRRMRILVLLPTYSQEAPTGAFVTSREYVRGLFAAGHVVHMVTTIREPGEYRIVDGVRVWPLRCWRRAVKAAHGVGDLSLRGPASREDCSAVRSRLHASACVPGIRL
ncbi:hypothetical protein ACWCQN_37260 [Streptomyces sp. NPDC001984]|uniref:hypothetical protein n=1 Tax=Streptomyces sp. NPDC002619 TaxID=3364655 RepID=UPI0036B35982